MKKYLMFIFCLISAVCLVSCDNSKKKGSGNNERRQGQLNPKNPSGGGSDEGSGGTRHSAPIVSDIKELFVINVRDYVTITNVTENEISCKFSFKNITTNKYISIEVSVHGNYDSFGKDKGALIGVL
jgi:hypothetical protein